MKTAFLKNKIARAALLVAVLVPTGCHDFLDKPVQGQLLSQNFPVTATDALNATTGVYSTLRENTYHFGLYPLTDIMSDDARKGSNPTDQSSTIGPYDSFTNIPTETTLPLWWNTLYEGIKRANVVIEKVPGISMDTTLRSRYIAEASFLRALFYFDLIRAWGERSATGLGVPLVTTTSPPLGLKRAKVQDVYNLIISDLTVAINSLPEKSQYSSADMGRATKGAAKGILAKVYLFLPTPDFVNAEKYALEVINSGQYSLEPNFYDANSQAGQFGVESIFEIGALPFENNSTDNGGDQYGNVQGVRGQPNRGWGFNRPTLDLMNAFEPGDPRRDSTIIFIGGASGEKQDVLDGVTIVGDVGTPDITQDGSGTTIEIECYNQKVWTPGINVATQFGCQRRILRYADILLIAAEASNENNKPAQALQYVNMIRARARGANNAILLDLTETNQGPLRTLILQERRVELALEGHRFWDLVRTNNAATVLGPLGFVTGKSELFPIPQTEVDLSQIHCTE